MDIFDKDFDDVEGYIVVCEDFHGYMGPLTKKVAEQAVKDMNASGPCHYRIVVNATLGNLLDTLASIEYALGEEDRHARN